MKAPDATALIEKGIQTHRIQRWADLGCGNGTFTNALAGLLPQGSSIYAIDQQSQHFGYPINFIRANFETDDLPISGLDGILMANSIHYVKDKQHLIRKLEGHFTGEANFLVVEYDTKSANQWVPYPLPFVKLKELFTYLGYKNISKLAERPSVYDNTNIYAAVARR